MHEPEGEVVGEQVAAHLRAARFASPPSAEEFAAGVERNNVPAVFRGAVKEWVAFSRWDPLHGGLDYLQEKVGVEAVVEAMTSNTLSNTGPVFYGDLRSHEKVPVPFSTFINFCKSHLQHLSPSSNSCQGQELLEVPTCSEETCSSSPSSSDQLYLAQVSILNTENRERCFLEVLKEDIQEPIFLKKKAFLSINFWMNRAHSRSSTHYDPNHNVLCVVAGCKKVTLWPPSASPFLYPMPVYGQASNHSSVRIEKPDFSNYIRAKHLDEYSQKIILNCGDALFIPEGWYHQVDSDDLTIAVNFWWKSRMMMDMLEHMDAYYLRLILNRLVDKEMNKMVQKSPLSPWNNGDNCRPANGASKGSEDSQKDVDNAYASDKKDAPLQSLEPFALQALYELISLVHESVKVDNQNHHVESAPGDVPLNQNSERKQSTEDDFSFLQNDPVANIIRSLEPLVLRKVLLAMVHSFPRTLEGLVLNLLGPAGAEILTRKFEEMDEQTTKEEQIEFYKLFYSIFDDQYAAMDVLLNGKELFSFQVFRNVLDQYLGVHVDLPKRQC